MPHEFRLESPSMSGKAAVLAVTVALGAVMVVNRVEAAKNSSVLSNPVLDAPKSANSGEHTAVITGGRGITLPSPPPTGRKYGDGLDFSTDKKRSRINNAAKAMLDRHADALAADPNATAVVVGYDSAAERVSKTGRLPPQVGALRAVNTKAYLVEERGIDSRRIALRTAIEDAQQVIFWIVPAGATVDLNSISGAVRQYEAAGISPTGERKP